MSPRHILTIVRIEHWVKNLFLFLPSFFAARLHEPTVWWRVLLGFLAFSLIASAVYILNDLVDAPHDRNHPDKCRRPIASGTVRKREAIALLCMLLLGGGRPGPEPALGVFADRRRLFAGQHRVFLFAEAFCHHRCLSD